MTYFSNKGAVDLSRRLEAGLAAHRAGDLAAAISAYGSVLALAPQHAGAQGLLGTAYVQLGRPAEAIPLLEQAARRQRGNPELLANLAQAYMAMARYDDAADAFRKASRVDPRNPHFQLGRAAAIASSGRFVEAEAGLERLASRLPNAALVWFNLGNVRRDLRKPEAAIEAYRKALVLDPQLADAFNNLGSVLHSLLRFAEAETVYRQCLAVAPDHLAARYNLASAVMDVGRFAEAEAISREIVALAPQAPEAHSILGAAMGHQNRLVEALPCYRTAARLAPSDAKIIATYASALVETRHIGEGLRHFLRSLRLDPALQSTRQVLGTALLGHGNLQDGWAEYRQRPAALRFREKYSHVKLAETLPERLDGSHVCVLREQGLGDEIFFLRFARVAAERGARITYRASEKLQSMLARTGWIASMVTEIAELPQADATVLVGDLPHALAARPQCPLDPLPVAEADRARLKDLPRRPAVFWPPVPESIALPPLPERLEAMRERLRALGPPPYIGVTWRAGTPPEEQGSATWVLYKNAPLHDIAGTMRELNATVVALQRKPAPGEITAFAEALGRELHDLTDLNEDLESMLALLALLDDYVTVSNTNVHLRAAVGRTARVLVPAPAEWRWMQDGHESPWFPGCPVYRQSLQGAWHDALTALERDLAATYGPASTGTVR